MSDRGEIQRGRMMMGTVVIVVFVLGAGLGGVGTWLATRLPKPDPAPVINLRSPLATLPEPTAVFRGFDNALLNRVTGQQQMDLVQQQGRWRGGSSSDYNAGRGLNGQGTYSATVYWTDSSGVKAVLARVEAELDAVIRRNNGVADPAVPTSSLADEKWGVELLEVRRSYRAGQDHHGTILAYLIAANGGKDFLLVIELIES